MARLWLLIGEGNTGKTKVARSLIEKIIDAGKQQSCMVAAMAPGNRNLAYFAPGTCHPAGRLGDLPGILA